jgi:hypothetical protein
MVAKFKAVFLSSSEGVGQLHNVGVNYQIGQPLLMSLAKQMQEEGKFDRMFLHVFCNTTRAMREHKMMRKDLGEKQYPEDNILVDIIIESQGG